MAPKSLGKVLKSATRMTMEGGKWGGSSPLSRKGLGRTVKMMKILFNNDIEFLDEVRKDKEAIERKVVRRTTLRKPSKETPDIFGLSVVATYRRGDEVVKLQKFCGNHSGRLDTRGNKKTKDKIKQTYEMLDREIEALGLQVRAGSYEE